MVMIFRGIRSVTDRDCRTCVSESLSLNFTEGNSIDYKFFDAQDIAPRLEFGYGLSYTTFEYASNITVQATGSRLGGYAEGELAAGGREDLWDIVATVQTSIANTGPFEGAEVAQLYVTFPELANKPIRQLRGLEKMLLQPGGEASVLFEVKRMDLSVWDTVAQKWNMVHGTYTMHVGASSRDLRVEASLTV
ncbi:hypothetical protein JX266_012598 [Neoarthrinium moseri]|nr:hypothetical protein JX266_012598 [Neoarthrinium moseri]